MKKWKRLSTEIINKNPWTEFRKDRFQMPDGTEGDYYYLHTTGMSLAVPVTKEGKIILHKQYRYLFDRDCIEFPGGGKREDQTYEEALVAELAEEAGVKAGGIKHVGDVAPANGVYSEMERVYVVWDMEDVEAESDTTEEFELLEMTVEEVDAVIISGEMWTGTSISAWTLARPHVIALIDQMKK